MMWHRGKYSLLCPMRWLAYKEHCPCDFLFEISVCMSTHSSFDRWQFYSQGWNCNCTNFQPPVSVLQSCFLQIRLRSQVKQFVDSSQPTVIVRKWTQPTEGEKCDSVISVNERQPNFQLGNKEYIWGWKAGEIAWLRKCSCSNDYCLITQRWKNWKKKKGTDCIHQVTDERKKTNTVLKLARTHMIFCRPWKSTSVLILDFVFVLGTHTPFKK